MRKTFLASLLLSFLFTTSQAQNSILEGYILESDNTTYLSNVEINIYQTNSNQLVVKSLSNQNGVFSVTLPVGFNYLIEASKDRFQLQTSTIFINSNDKNKKVFTKIKMRRESGNLSKGTLIEPVMPGQTDIYTARSGEVLPSNIVNGIESYGIDSKIIRPTTNPEGVNLVNELYEQDPYAEVTNATRLVDENYFNTADRELMKRQPMKTAFKSEVSVNPYQPIRQIGGNTTIPNNYDNGATNKKIIIPEPQFGETLVASTNSKELTHRIPNFYTGYKVEFVTALERLPADHAIFRQHGNITMD